MNSSRFITKDRKRKKNKNKNNNEENEKHDLRNVCDVPQDKNHYKKF